MKGNYLGNCLISLRIESLWHFRPTTENEVIYGGRGKRACLCVGILQYMQYVCHALLKPFYAEWCAIFRRWETNTHCFSIKLVPKSLCNVALWCHAVFFFFFFCGQCALRQDTINRIHFAVSDKEVGYRDVVCIICIFITTVI